MDKTEKRQQRRERLMSNRLYQTLRGVTNYMDRFYLDAIIGVIPGWGDAFAAVSVLPFLYFSLFVIRSIPLTLAVINNALRDILFGMIPFFVGDVIDIFHRANIQNMQMVQGFVDGDEAIIRTVNRRAWQAALVMLLLLVLIALMVWALIEFGAYLWSLVAGLF